MTKATNGQGVICTPRQMDLADYSPSTFEPISALHIAFAVPLFSVANCPKILAICRLGHLAWWPCVIVPLREFYLQQLIQ